LPVQAYILPVFGKVALYVFILRYILQLS